VPEVVMDRSRPDTKPVTAQEQLLISELLNQERDHALILLDVDARIIGWHMGAEQLFGYQVEEILGEQLDRIFVPEDRARGEPQLERELAIRVGKAEDDRWTLRKDGSRFWANGILTGLRNQQNTLVGFAKIVRDRTDVKAQVDTYANRVAALESAQERKNLFISTLAHELRNPLAVLSNVTHLLSNASAASRNDAMATKLLKRQVDFMQSVVDDLFEAARIAHGKVHLNLRATALRAIVDRAIETCGALVEGTGQNVEVLFPPGEIVVSADAARLQQAFVNLIGNALKHSGGASTIWVKATVEGDHAVVRIRDEGKGISHELLPFIFELFTQATPSDAGTPLGIGLGLGIVKGIVEMHGGTVHARSEGEGRGSEFIVRLPVA
jgi:PAS domain S-box-containing protein